MCLKNVLTLIEPMLQSAAQARRNTVCTVYRGFQTVRVGVAVGLLGFLRNA